MSRQSNRPCPFCRSDVERFGRSSRRNLFSALVACMFALPSSAFANQAAAVTAIDAFVEICTQPGQTTERVTKRMNSFAQRAGFNTPPFEFEFYDITLEDTDLSITPGTNRRCEVRFAGDHRTQAKAALLDFVEHKRFGFPTEIPSTHANARVPGTDLFVARQLQSGPKAVVHMGIDQAGSGTFTFINVERLPR